MKKFEEINIEIQRPDNGPITELNNNMALVFTQYKKMREYATKLENKLRNSVYNLQLEKEHRVETEEISELKRENQRLRAENLAVKTLVEDAKKQQPEIPEVPQFVEEYAQDCERELSYLLEEIYLDTDYLEDHSTRNEREGLIARYWLYNRTVAKEKRFYLKHGLTGQFLAKRNQKSEHQKYFFWTGENPLTHSIGTAWELKFTQSEIDSMETESYEQIEVEE